MWNVKDAQLMSEIARRVTEGCLTVIDQRQSRLSDLVMGTDCFMNKVIKDVIIHEL